MLVSSHNLSQLFFQSRSTLFALSPVIFLFHGSFSSLIQSMEIARPLFSDWDWIRLNFDFGSWHF